MQPVLRIIEDMRERRTREMAARGRRILPVAAAMAAVLLAACTSAETAARVKGSPNTPASVPTARPTESTPAPPLPTASSTYDPNTDPLVEVVKRVAPAVVNVTTRVVDTGIFGGGAAGRAVGTGFIIRSDGVIVTNFHVVEGAVNIKVTLPPPDGQTFQARVIGGDSNHDLAVLRVDGKNLPTVTMGDSSQLELGERVVALGYALALPGGPSVTSGIISALARTVQAQDPNGGTNGAGITRTYEDALQTDAAINPGNSGGPLIDLAGNVVGINTAGNSTAQNIGFSIAINAAKPLIQDAIAHPAARQAYMGVTTQTVDSGLANQLGLKVKSGALIVALAPGGPASKTSIKPNDVIVSFDGKAITTSEELGTAILARKPGDVVPVIVVHPDGTRSTVSVTLGTRPLPH
ncbi:MAG TPA: protease DO family protein [Actinobacteria bacterium]|nr:protease DO family protein [Actinomycetota bacterium]HCP62736.1 protease DO family protein [Actinomycetota bacterium]